MARVRTRTRLVAGGFGLVLLVVSLVSGLWLTAVVGALAFLGQAWELRAARRRLGG